MQAVKGMLAGFGILGVLIYLGLIGTVLVSSIVGLYLAFSASILLGIIVLLVEPSPLVIGLVYLFTGTDLAEKLVNWFNTL